MRLEDDILILSVCAECGTPLVFDQFQCEHDEEVADLKFVSEADYDNAKLDLVKLETKNQALQNKLTLALQRVEAFHEDVRKLRVMQAANNEAIKEKNEEILELKQELEDMTDDAWSDDE